MQKSLQKKILQILNNIIDDTLYNLFHIVWRVTKINITWNPLNKRPPNGYRIANVSCFELTRTGKCGGLIRSLYINEEENEMLLSDFIGFKKVYQANCRGIYDICLQKSLNIKDILKLEKNKFL